MSFFRIAQQCCDASDYVAWGAECANGIKCYGELRPIGDYLWFAIPPKMGWPMESLIVASLVLMFISVLLSIGALGKLLPLTTSSSMVRTCRIFVLLLLSLAIHAIFLWPTMFNALSDPPSNVLLMSGVWLLILAHFNSHTIIRGLQFFLAGLCLGLSVWLRAYYLYPVLMGLLAYIVLWLFSSNRKWVELLLLVALLPIVTQYLVMYREYGTFGYIGSASNTKWAEVHLNSTVAGYDTVLPRNGYAWQPQFCDAKLGILGGLSQGDFKSVACVIAGRLYLYFGTYEPETYISTSVKNKLVSPYFESIGSPDWWSKGLDWQENVELAPDGEKTADKLTVTEPSPDGAGDVVQWVSLQDNTPYTLSVWLWSPLAKTVNLSIMRQRDQAVVALQQFTLSPVPTRYSITGTTLTTELYDIVIGRTPYKNEGITFGTERGDFLYAWGAQLESGDQMTAYNGIEVALPDSVRKWRPMLVLANGVVLLLCLTMFLSNRSFWLQHRTGLSISVIFLASLAEGVVIIPEQRFAIGWMIFFWLLATAYVSSFLPGFIAAKPALNESVTSSKSYFLFKT